MKAKIMLCILVLLLSILCGCSGNIAISQRAIVKCIYADENNGVYTVVVLAFNSKPETDMSSAQGTPMFYKGQGSNIDQAFKEAEKNSAKKLFYAHNRLLIFGKNASLNITPYIDYFGGGALPRNMTMYAADFSAADFEEWEDKADAFVRECETLSDKMSAALSDIKADKTESGFIPILSADNEKQMVKTDKLLLYYNGMPYAECKDNAMQLVLLLSSKTNALKLDANGISIKAQGVNIEKTADKNTLSINVIAPILYVEKDGVLLKDNDAQKAADEISEYINGLFKHIIKITTTQTKDVFGFVWWYKMKTDIQSMPNNINADIVLKCK